MNKDEFAGAIAKESGLSKSDAEKALGALVVAITKALQKGDKISIDGFCTIWVGRSDEGSWRNPMTGKEIHLVARNLPRFNVDDAFMDLMNPVALAYVKSRSKPTTEPNSEINMNTAEPNSEIRMNSAELSSTIAQESKLSKADAGKVLDAFVVVITRALQEGNKISIDGFCTIGIDAHPWREGRDPRTGEKKQIPPINYVIFRADEALKDLLNPK